MVHTLSPQKQYYISNGCTAITTGGRAEKLSKNEGIQHNSQARGSVCALHISLETAMHQFTMTRTFIALFWTDDEVGLVVLELSSTVSNNTIQSGEKGG